VELAEKDYQRSICERDKVNLLKITFSEIYNFALIRVKNNEFLYKNLFIKRENQKLWERYI
jgi:hypothetical protein